MIGFYHKGIRIESTIETTQRYYDHKRDGKRVLLDKNIEVAVNFWEFSIENGNLTELALIKSNLQFYIHCFWKRSSRSGFNLKLEKSIEHMTSNGPLTLSFIAREKNKQLSLYIFLMKSGKVIEEIYLDVQEVMMLDIAINKAINMLTPTPKGYGTPNYITYPT